MLSHLACHTYSSRKNLYATLCYAYATLCYAMLRHATLCFATYTGEVRFTNEEIMMAPPHRVDHRVVDHKESRSIHATTPAPAGRSRAGLSRAGLSRGDRSPGGDGGGGGPPSFLTIAIQTDWPEDPGATEGKLVESIQDERAKLPERVRALRVRRTECDFLSL